MKNIDEKILAQEIWEEGVKNSFFLKNYKKNIEVLEYPNKEFGYFVVIPTEPEISSQNLNADEWLKKMNSAPKDLRIELKEEILITDEFVARNFTAETLVDTVKDFFSDSISNRLDKIIRKELESNSTTAEKIETGDFSMILVVGGKPDLISEPRDYKNRIGFQFYRAVGVKQIA